LPRYEELAPVFNAEAKAPEPVAVISRVGCPHCQRAKDLLIERKIRFNEIVVGQDIDQAALRGLSGSTSVPQVFIGGRLVGGADELTELLLKAG
jgi:glutaredoxin-like protein